MKECREMKQLKHGKLSYACPDCGSSCSAVTGSPGLEICNSCDTAALIPADMERWQQYLPMMADYEVDDKGNKKLLGWHPKATVTGCACMGGTGKGT